MCSFLSFPQQSCKKCDIPPLQSRGEKLGKAWLLTQGPAVWQPLYHSAHQTWPAPRQGTALPLDPPISCHGQFTVPNIRSLYMHNLKWQIYCWVSSSWVEDLPGMCLACAELWPQFLPLQQQRSKIQKLLPKFQTRDVLMISLTWVFG